MYIVSEYIDRDKLPAERADELMTAHRAWFKAHFDRGDFLIVGPYLDAEGAGIMIAQAESREALEEILRGDVFYADDMARYEVHEFRAAMVADGITAYTGK
ncbi:YciI family protein [Selenomonas artemidis]|uniref:YciI family protein n=1 Tax=Selenomonas artemidis TaxID=671224 RepID=UPI0028D0BBF8|nr:YciI family protein [Selenomonas artemidis]